MKTSKARKGAAADAIITVFILWHTTWNAVCVFNIVRRIINVPFPISEMSSQILQHADVNVWMDCLIYAGHYQHDFDEFLIIATNTVVNQLN